MNCWQRHPSLPLDDGDATQRQRGGFPTLSLPFGFRPLLREVPGGAHKVDVADLMRRMVKEEMLRFDGTRLFPERRAYTASYRFAS